MVNDMTIIFTIVTIFIAVGFFAPIINDEFGSSYNANDPSSIEGDIDPDTLDGGVNGWQIIKSIFSMFFWSFGVLPTFIDIVIFFPLRIILVLTISRNIWVGGGS